MGAERAVSLVGPDVGSDVHDCRQLDRWDLERRDPALGLGVELHGTKIVASPRSSVKSASAKIPPAALAASRCWAASVACSSPSAPWYQTSASARSTVSVIAAAAVVGTWRCWTRGSARGLLEQVSLGLRSDGKDDATRAYEEWFGAVPDLGPIPEGIAFGDDVLVAYGQLHGTMKGLVDARGRTTRRAARRSSSSRWVIRNSNSPARTKARSSSLSSTSEETAKTARRLGPRPRTDRHL